MPNSYLNRTTGSPTKQKNLHILLGKKGCSADQIIIPEGIS